jgi:hypothetical protein
VNTCGAEAGADHVCVQALGDDPMTSYRELAARLFGHP